MAFVFFKERRHLHGIDELDQGKALGVGAHLDPTPYLRGRFLKFSQVPRYAVHHLGPGFLCGSFLCSHRLGETVRQPTPNYLPDPST